MCLYVCCEIIDFSFRHFISTFKNALTSYMINLTPAAYLRVIQSIQHFRKDGSVKKLLGRQNHYYLTKSYHFTNLAV